MKVVEHLLVALGVWMVLGSIASVFMGRWIGKVGKCYPETSDRPPGE